MFENLPNEIILQIYSFLELNDMYRSFSLLNARFDSLLYDEFIPIYARITRQLSFPLERFLSRITYLSLVDFLPNDTLSILEQNAWTHLTVLKIASRSELYLGPLCHEMIHQILLLRKLRSCELELAPTIFIRDPHLPVSTSIKHLKLSMITIDMLFYLLKNVPELRSLSIWLNSNGRVFDVNTYDQNYRCENLRKLTLGLHNDIRFVEARFLLLRMPVLHSLKLVGSVWDDEFLNEHHWIVILSGEHSFPLLRKVNIDISVRWVQRLPNVDTILSRFQKRIFRRTNFTVTYDRKFWFYIKCLWNG
ncbi:unnamed protein product [Adineta ricciae]|uniref:F-box domain-containing protein n=1 Tax=Adineta ricciae TaxID=249248 RepID=A0A814QEK0_ADIRI|nr:unnamed protein product [Adineta ricciae]